LRPVYTAALLHDVHDRLTNQAGCEEYLADDLDARDLEAD